MSKNRPTKDNLWGALETLDQMIMLHVPPSDLSGFEQQQLAHIRDMIQAENARFEQTSLFVGTEYDMG